MRPSEKPIFLDLLNEIATFYDKILADSTIEIYWDDLKFYTIPELKSAFSEFRKKPRSGKFMPKTCDIIELIPAATQKKPEFACKHDNCDSQLEIGGYCAVHYEMLRPMTPLEEKLGVKFYNTQKTSPGTGQIH